MADAGRGAQVGSERRLTVGRVRTRSNLRPAPKMLVQKRATTSRPSYSKGIGGIEMKTSSVRRATSASRSADSHALTLGHDRILRRCVGGGRREAVRSRRSAAVGAANWRAPV